MGTAIEWTGETWNPTTGCDRVSEGCSACYALTLAGRLKAMGQAKYQRDGDPRTSGPGFGLTLHPDALDIPLRRKKPTTWFVDSMSDLFHPEVPNDFIVQVWLRMALTRQHTFQVLTKRPQRPARLLTDPKFSHEVYYGLDDYVGDDGPLEQAALEELTTWEGHESLANVWLGTSIELDRYVWRADHLRRTPAAIRFLSLEPLLGPVPSLDLTGIDWVIVGGESGSNARPMNPSWVRQIRDRCVDAGVPFFFKQHGGRTPKAGGRELDGRTWDEMPAHVGAVA
ncbi:MAG TPA: phage Gp37/Gp68 family protein [Acidimicrobiales bacterium]|nr:phage Gp37/Gp68 family protein [Acidimicrobiales bacterium]